MCVHRWGEFIEQRIKWIISSRVTYKMSIYIQLIDYRSIQKKNPLIMIWYKLNRGRFKRPYETHVSPELAWLLSPTADTHAHFLNLCASSLALFVQFWGRLQFSPSLLDFFSLVFGRAGAAITKERGGRPAPCADDTHLGIFLKAVAQKIYL